MTLWLCIDGDVKFPWIKFKIPEEQADEYKILDAILCHGMGKMVVASNKGRLLIYNGKVRREERGEMGQVQMPIILKVAHEVKHLPKVMILFNVHRQQYINKVNCSDYRLYPGCLS